MVCNFATSLHDLTLLVKYRYYIFYIIIVIIIIIIRISHVRYCNSFMSSDNIINGLMYIMIGGVNITFFFFI